MTTAYDFATVQGTSIAFDVAADTLTFTDGSAAQVVPTISGSDLVLSLGADAVTLTGVSLAELSSSFITFSDGSSLIIGDNTTDVTADNSAQSGGGAILVAGNNDNQVRGMDGADSITVGDGSNLIFGGRNSGDGAETGNDTIVAGTGADTIYGNGGDDDVTIGATAANKNAFIYGGGGDDNVTSGIGNSHSAIYVSGGHGSDDIDLSASTGAATIYGGNTSADGLDGDDTILGSSGASALFGNGGNDDITVNTGGAHEADVYGGRGDDTITGGAVGSTSSDYIVYGGLGNDQIDLSSVHFSGDVTIYGGNSPNDLFDGNDTISSGTGDATIFGNAGNDALSLVGLVAGSDGTLYGGKGNDTLVANAIDDTAGATLVGGGGNDLFQTLNTVAGSTVIISDFTATDDAISLYGTGQYLSVSTSVSDTTLFYDLNNNGTKDAGESALVLNGFTGPINTGSLESATLTTSTGAVVMYNGGGDAASLTGLAAKNDALIAGSNGDTINGHTGADWLVGGSGHDVFVFASGDSGTTVTTVDTIVNLDVGTGAGAGAHDKINFGGVIDQVVDATATDYDTGNAALTNALSAVATAQFGNGGGEAAVLFVYGGQTYLAMEKLDDAATFVGAADVAINVTGITGTLDLSDFT